MAVRLRFLLPVDEEKRIFLPDRAAERTTVLIQVEFLWRSREKALRVQRCVAQELKQRTVEIVRTRFRRHKHRWSRTRSVFRRVVVGQNLEFLNRIDPRENSDAARRQFVVVHPIQQPVRRVRPRAADRQRERPARRNFAVRAAREEAVRIRLLHSARRQRRKLYEVASVQRKLRYLLPCDDLPQRWIRRLHGDRRCFDLNLRRHCRRRQRKVQRARLIDLQLYVALFGRLKSRELHVHRVVRRGQQRDKIVSDLVGLHFARYAGCFRDRAYRRARYRTARLIRDCAREASDRLPVRGRRKRDQQCKDTQNN